MEGLGTFSYASMEMDGMFGKKHESPAGYGKGEASDGLCDVMKIDEYGDSELSGADSWSEENNDRLYSKNEGMDRLVTWGLIEDVNELAAYYENTVGRTPITISTPQNSTVSSMESIEASPLLAVAEQCSTAPKKPRTKGRKNAAQKDLSLASNDSAVCPTCNVRFFRKYEMIRHVKATHLKVRPHKCEHCSKSFSRSSHLRVHIRSLHKISPLNITAAESA